MARVLRRCPKCSSKITNKIECRSCGLLFERYFKAEALKRAEEKARAQKKTKARQVISTVVSLILVAIVCGAGFYYYNNRTDGADEANSSPNKALKQQTIASTPAAGGAEDSANVSRAKQATVSIATPWGSGTGFFVTKDLVVTNKHIVEQKKDGLEEARSAFENYRDRVAQENEKLQKMKEQHTAMADGPSKDELTVIIEDGEQQLDKALAEQQRLEDKVIDIEKRLENNEIVAVLGDGRELAITNPSYSQTFDLALLTVIGANIEGIALPPSGRSLTEGNRLFTIGPRNTSIPSTFTGFYRGESTEEFFIQTDKSFNSNNSGGPLIDEDGYVRGVSTTTTTQLEGMGLAIPIETVMSEFNL